MDTVDAKYYCGSDDQNNTYGTNLTLGECQ